MFSLWNIHRRMTTTCVCLPSPPDRTGIDKHKAFPNLFALKNPWYPRETTRVDPSCLLNIYGQISAGALTAAEGRSGNGRNFVDHRAVRETGKQSATRA
jgi:hypothetical protein